MKVDVKIAGANYTEVPAILLPLTAGGKARFCEVSDTTAEPRDVATGKRFYTADGELIEGTASSSTPIDTRKKITVIQKEHQTLTISCNHPDLSLSNDESGNVVYATEYPNTVSVTLKADSEYYTGKITVNGAEQEGSSANRQATSISISITDGMVISATDAVQIPTVSFTDVTLTMQGQGTQMFLGDVLMTKEQSPDTPHIDAAILAETGGNKALLFLTDTRYENCTVILIGGADISETVQLQYFEDSDLGKVIGCEVKGDALYQYLKDGAKNQKEVILRMKVVS